LDQPEVASVGTAATSDDQIASEMDLEMSAAE
jgi:hypothetical protein